jgi:excisionase family DNA binding protein
MTVRLALSVPEAARALGIATSTCWERVRDSSLPSVRLGDRVLIPLPLLAERLGCRPADLLELLKATEDGS